MKEFVAKLNEATLAAYRARPALIREHHGIEQTVLAGGYGYRQILELVQNGADAILEAQDEGPSVAERNRIHVELHGSSLYVANTGAPLSEDGVDALLSSHSSPKRGNQIGRFGLGFKSLLRLGGKIDMFTRGAAAIRFDPQRCHDEIKKQFRVPEAPSLRLAWPLGDDQRPADQVLSQFSWAETVVRVDVQKKDLLEHLRQEIQGFPAEFLLFFPVSTSLTLDDGEKSRRELHVAREGMDHLLHDGDDSTRWRVASREITVTDERALADATHIHARQSVPVAWAVPMKGKAEEAGRFWAFFPTQTPTFVPGILNAPWKLNSDRNAIIGGEWNTALMQAAADLVVTMLPSLATTKDPGRPLDAFPRQPDRKDEVAAPLLESVWEALETAKVIADGTGELKSADEFWRHPSDNVALATQWLALAPPEQVTDIVHPSCLERQRYSRLNALAERLVDDESETPNLKRCSPESWFDSVAAADAPTAVNALRLAEAFADDCKPQAWREIRPQLSIIPSHSGELLTAAKAILAPVGTSIPGREPVAPALCEDVDATRILAEVMKVSALDDRVWEAVLHESLAKIPRYAGEERDAGWLAFWSNLRAAPDAIRHRVVTNNRNRICIRRRDESWVLFQAVLLPGALISADDDSENQDLLVDEQVHGEDCELIAALGVVEMPEGTVSARNEADLNTLSRWLSDSRSLYKRTHDNSASWNYLEPSSLDMPNGWRFLQVLDGAPNVKLTERFLVRMAQGEFTSLLDFGHCTMGAYPRLQVAHPLPQYVLEHGQLVIGEFTVTLRSVLARRHEPALLRVAALRDALADLEKLDDANASENVPDDEINDLWLALIDTLATPAALTDDSLQDLWRGAAKDLVVPESLPSDAGETPLSKVYVTGSSELASCVRAPNRLVVTLDDEVLKLWVSRGAADLATRVKPSYADVTGPADLLVSAFPELGEVLQSEARESGRAQPVVDLTLRIHYSAEPIPCLMWENSLLFDRRQLDQRSRVDRLMLLLSEVAAAGWLKCEPEEALQRLGDAGVDERRARVASGRNLTERLMFAVGGRSAPLQAALGEVADAECVQQCSVEQLAELTLAQLGPATLVILKDTLDEEGLKPPRRWNTPEARNFVASLKFPHEFAASLQKRRHAEEHISGPIALPPLHDFQEEVLEGVRTLIASSAGRRRTVVSLPTGGGKTRVTVEAAVRLVLEPKGRRRSVVWVAQTEELCEQAVQAFRHVWINLGAQKTDLRVIRLWGGHPNPVIQDPDDPIVVVASIQTLNSRMGSAGLEWLRTPGLVVVDECHHAITPEYTNLLRWLDAEAARPGAPIKEEPPIIGLSATPFRMDDDESQRLAKRFDNRWLPADQERLHARLRSQGVLATATYEELPGVGLLPEEIEQLSQLGDKWDGLALENILEAINQRLGGDNKRNERLVDRIQRCDERSILFFANSVRHAVEMSARLNLAGVPAAAISGGTPAVARRYFLNRFQRGEVRVICNHSVLTTGFDAPKTDMVLIARQVFSPVRFMQMVGRGLRGKENGGTEQCRIVTVIDNLGRFQDRHPYHYCKEYYCAMVE